MLFPVEHAHAKTVDRRESIVRIDLADVGVSVEVNAMRVDDRISIPGAEPPRRQTELPHLGPDRVRIEWQCLELLIALHPVARVVVVWSEVENLLGAGVEWVEVLTTDRPAAVRHPGSSLEIDRIIRRAETGPVAGGAAEVMKSRRLQRIIGLPDDLAAIEILHLRLEIESTAREFARRCARGRGRGREAGGERVRRRANAARTAAPRSPTAPIRLREPSVRRRNRRGSGLRSIH